MKQIDYTEAESLNPIWIDARTPLEYKESTILGAYNFPILLDQERIDVSTVYRNESRSKAKHMGLEFAQSKLADYYKQISDIQKREKRQIVFFCFRGGMRSNSLASVMSLMGLPCMVLKGGYKAYRRHVMDSLSNDSFYNDKQFVVLHGKTGVGKTRVLLEMENRNAEILDLEGYAKNKGSIFGGIPFDNIKINQKQFETLIYNKLNSKCKYIFLESESKKVGANIVPEKLFDKMTNAEHILIECSDESRIRNILLDYPLNSDTIPKYKKIIMRMDALSKAKREELCNKLDSDINEEVVLQIMKMYYDNLYKYSIKQYNYKYTISSDDINIAAKKICQIYGV